MLNVLQLDFAAMISRNKKKLTKKWPDGHKWPNMAKMAIYGHLAIEPYVTNMGKWGIPEKSYENVAQQN